MFKLLLSAIPGFSQAKIVAIIVGVLAVFGTIGYLKYENVQLENRTLKVQNLLDRANDTIRQEKEANDSLVSTIKQLKEQITNIIHEQKEAIKTDQTTTAIKEKKSQKLNEQLDKLDAIKPNSSITGDSGGSSYDEAQEKFLKEYNADLECRNNNPGKLSACQ